MKHGNHPTVVRHGSGARITSRRFLTHRIPVAFVRKKRQGFGSRPAPDPTTVDAHAPLTRKKPEWVVQEVLRLKALMGKQIGCRKVADTFNRLHAPTRVGKSFVSNTIRNHQYALLNISRCVFHAMADTIPR